MTTHSDRYSELGPRALWFLENLDELDLAESCAGAERTEAAVARVRALHQPFPYSGQQLCAECCASAGQHPDSTPTSWPCPTISALDEEPDV